MRQKRVVIDFIDNESFDDPTHGAEVFKATDGTGSAANVAGHRRTKEKWS